MTEIARSSGVAERELLAGASEAIEDSPAEAARPVIAAPVLTYWRLGGQELSVRGLRRPVLRKGFEQREITNAQLDDDHHAALPFVSQLPRRLVAMVLKSGNFKAAYEVQMKLYLKWLDRYERREGEGSPIRLILCTQASREQVEMHSDGIVVTEYGTGLPPNAEPQTRVHQTYEAASEWLARREIETSSEQGGTE